MDSARARGRFRRVPRVPPKNSSFGAEACSEEVRGRMLVADDVALPSGPATAAATPAGGRGDAEASLVADVSPRAEASGHALSGAGLWPRLAAHGGTGRTAAAELLVALALSLAASGAALVPGHTRTVPSSPDQAWSAVALRPADAFAKTFLCYGCRSSGATARDQVTLGASWFAVGVTLGVPHLGARVT